MIVDMDESTKPASSWQYNRLENPFIEGMTVGFASDAQEQLSGQVVTEEILTSEIPIPNMAIPNMQIQVPFGDLGLPVEPATYLQLIDDTEGGLEIRRQAELELESLHILQAKLDLMWESEQTLEQEHFAVDSWITTEPLTYGAAQYVLNRFANGHQTSAELLAQAINAFAAHASIPK
jgi:hypothetical protein